MCLSLRDNGSNRSALTALCFQEEEELDSHTMVKSGPQGVGTMRAASTMSEGAQTMIEHSSTMLDSDLGTMVINSEGEEEEDGTVKRMCSFPGTSMFCSETVLPEKPGLFCSFS